MVAVHALNYRPNPAYALGLRQRRVNGKATRSQTFMIGYFAEERVFEGANRGDDYYSRIMMGIQRAVHKERYHLLYSIGATDSVALPDLLLEERVDGLLVEGSFPGELRKHLVQRLPVTFIDRCYYDSHASSVMPDFKTAVYTQLEYLWALGHRNIVTFHPQCLEIQTREYRTAFERFFEDRELAPIHPTLCQPRRIDVASHSTVMAQYARAIMAAQPRPTAVMSTDTYASSLLIELQHLGVRVPEQISVLGMGDTFCAKATDPQLTSYRFPLDEIGQSATNLLIEQIRDPGCPVRHLFIGGAMVERKSCAAPCRPSEHPPCSPSP